MIGKEIRLKRLMPTEDGKYFGLTVDHAMGRGVMKGLDTIDDDHCQDGGRRSECHHHA